MALRTSRRSLIILAEIKKSGLDLGLVLLNNSSSGNNAEDEKELPFWACEVEYPLTKELIEAHGKESALSNTERFKLIHVHVTVLRGPYQGGTFILEVDLRDVKDYPTNPPKCRYLTKIWHPNVHEETGKICHSHLRSPFGPRPGTWNPMLRLQPLITGILGHLNPEDQAFAPQDPLNTFAASQYLNNVDDFLKQAKDWTMKYARSKDIPFENSINYQ